MKKERNLIHIECIRILAAYFVIFNHTGNDGFFLFAGYDRGKSPLLAVYVYISTLQNISPVIFYDSGSAAFEKR